jgi:uncharacterized membrane protein YobD (UPF0266 family)
MAQENGTALFSWEADEFQTHERGLWWYVGVFGLAILAIIYAIYIKNWMFIGVVVMIVVALFVLGRVAPRKFVHTITDKGVKVGDKFYSYSELKSFWVVDDVATVLNILTAKKYALLLTLQLAKGDVEKVRTILSEYLPEESDRGEDRIDKISRLLKF